MPTAFRWGILATGRIAATMAADLCAAEDAELVAVASRSQEAADRFGERWGIPRRYGRYEDLVADPDVEIVYIATPHSLHADNIRLCLEAGKHVLCEKPLTLNARQAADCIALAREKGLFLMEAVWMRFFPAIQQAHDWVRSGVLGTVRLIQADFCFHAPFDPHSRLYNPALGGGALLDVGIYPLSLATMLLGFPDEVQGNALLAPTGVDATNALMLIYPESLALLSSSVAVEKPQEAWIVGDEGRIHLHAPFFHPEQVTLERYGEPPLTCTFPHPDHGYGYEIAEVHACLRAGLTESPRMPLDESQRLLALMDTLRARWGVRYPGEDEDTLT
ncbi:hypothetical protein ARMA_0543 [Ardenticatena maritima]|uniref:Uncharacterized protein n=1 Tax=Ardenticatena maritima TaxID=872965 RepID=A0A0M9UBU3_9CHLR|nr:Gfo/Idh/MocA family oxidoreductase [Ardenticatena maritima]KPL87646.1 hypothetical protein SE16_08490 [Ardenticatena maritima]GAP62120.1 hypothetical protein ARMA_0543 [Ardenticatena maritima]